MNKFLLLITFLLVFFVSNSYGNKCSCRKSSQQRDANKLFPFLFNISQIKENTPNYDFFRVYLKESKKKGIGIYASKMIPSNRTIMYYKLKVFEKYKYDLLNHGKYSFVVYKNSCQKDNDKVADIYKNSNPKPRGRKPFWVNICFFNLNDRIAIVEKTF